MRGFRLNGWQRIGIVLSVVWLVVGTLWGWSELFGYAYRMHQLCLDLAYSSPPMGDPAACDVNEKFAEAEKQRWVYAAGFGLMPIPIVWLLVYSVVWIMRWVRRGFQPAR